MMDMVSTFLGSEQPDAGHIHSSELAVYTANSALRTFPRKSSTCSGEGAMLVRRLSWKDERVSDGAIGDATGGGASPSTEPQHPAGHNGLGDGAARGSSAGPVRPPCGLPPLLASSSPGSSFETPLPLAPAAGAGGSGLGGCPGGGSGASGVGVLLPASLTARGTTASSEEGLQDLIDDRRATPIKADHPDIVATFTQGLANVETIVLFDNESCVSDFEFEQLGQADGSFLSRLSLRLGDTCSALCSCHFQEALHSALPFLVS
mmetsp:Transcript_151526/g.486258  ORF Transcript_151526/g.486258 Transcript_151526/m.486258 type:complete len:263 (-) Transcript_151526:99-887(-)